MTTDPTPSPRDVFAARLRAARLARGFRTAKSFAERLGLEQNTYTRYERGEVEPNIAILERIWIALDLVPNELFGRPVRDPQTDPRRSRTTARLTIDPRDALAWHLATTYVRAIPMPDAPRGSAGELRRIAALFADLTTQPFDTVGQLALDPLADAVDEAAREGFLATLAKFSSSLEDGPLPRRARSGRPRSKA